MVLGSEYKITRHGKRLAHCENRIYDVDNELPRKRGLFYFCEIFENNMWGQQVGKQVISKLEQVSKLDLTWNYIGISWNLLGTTLYII